MNPKSKITLNEVQLLHALKKKNWQLANEAFARVMQEKVNQRLHQENRILFETVMSAPDVQRVFDETQNVSETELLCGITDLHVNSKGEVVGYQGF